MWVLLLILAAVAGIAFAGYQMGMLGPRMGAWVVPRDKVGVVERRFGRAAPQWFPRVVPYDMRGVYARVLMPGRQYWFTPGMYRVWLVDRTDVPSGMIGLVRAKEGAKREKGSRLGRHVECDDFQDGAKFLLDGGEIGWQVATLPSDASYYINIELFEVKLVPRTYVPPGTVGLVTAKDGKVLPPEQRFGNYAACDDFQDGEAFLKGGGQQGWQLPVLSGGTYYDINTELFEVITADNVEDVSNSGGLTADHLKEVAIPVGNTGVVVTLDGAEPERDEQGKVKLGPRVPGHRNFRLPWVFMAGGGHRGVQEETLGEGAVYALNPWFVRVVLVPTRTLILEWSKKESFESGNYDAALGPIFVNIQGHPIRVELSQTLRIPEAAAPILVSQFGDSTRSGLGGLVANRAPVQRFVERELGRIVETYFSAITSESTVEDFLTAYASIRTDLTSQVRNALAAWGIEAQTAGLGEYEALDPQFDIARRRVFDEQIRNKELGEQEKNALVEARIQEIQYENKKKTEELKVAALAKEIELLGQDAIALRMFLSELKSMGVPEVISGDADALLRYLPMQRALDLIEGARKRQLQSGTSPEQATGQVTEGPGDVS